MKVLIIGGNRFMGLRLSHALARDKGIDLHIVNRTGQVAHAAGATVYKCDRANWRNSHIDKDWDAIVDFACFTERDARETLEYFGTLKRYVYISSGSVYDYGTDLREESFQADSFDLAQAPLSGDPAYQDGKRRGEAVFTQLAPFPTLSVRFPFVLGPDDYTRRLDFHVQRIERGQPIYMPNPKALVSLLHAEDACRFLQWSLARTDVTGPLNVASAAPIALDALLKRIESKVGRKALMIQQGTAENSSAYGVDKDHTVNVERARLLGFSARPIDSWIDDLIDSARLSTEEPGSRHRLH